VVKQTGKVLLLEGRKVPGTALQLKEALGRDIQFSELPDFINIHEEPDLFSKVMA
jgi:hypothetical protein